jgi:hypothetical protein
MSYLLNYEKWTRLVEQTVYKSGGDPYEYKVINGVWYTKGPKIPDWKSLAGNQAAVSKLDNRYPDARKEVKKPDSDQPKIVKPTTKVGDEKNKPAPAPVEQPVGKNGQDSLKLSPKYQIDPTKILPSGGVVCDTTKGGCAGFLRDADPDNMWIGDAWTTYSSTASGTRIWSAFEGVNKDLVNKAVAAWKEIGEAIKKGYRVPASGGGTYLSKIKRITESIIAAKPFTDPSILQVGDFVGVYHPASRYHETAFWYGSNPSNDQAFRKWFEAGKPTQSVIDRNVWGLNTHIGRVYSVDGGNPTIIHAIDKKVRIDPWNKITGGSDRIAWVKRRASTKKQTAPSAPPSKESLIDKLISLWQ